MADVFHKYCQFLFQNRASQVHSNCKGQVGTTQVGITQVGIFQQGPGQVGIVQVSTAQVGTG